MKGTDQYSWRLLFRRRKNTAALSTSRPNIMVMTGKLSGPIDFIQAEKSRPLKVGVSNVWEEEFGQYFDGITKDYARNPDHNSGNPIGMAVSQYTVAEGRRITASGTFLSSKPTNLTVQVESAVEKIIFEGLRAVGIVASGKQGKLGDFGLEWYSARDGLTHQSTCEEGGYSIRGSYRFAQITSTLWDRTQGRLSEAKHSTRP